MKLKHNILFGVVVFAAAWLFDFLFWQQQPGISVLIYIICLIGFGLFIAWREGYRPAWQSLILLVPILFFAVMIAVRLEPLTKVVGYMLILSLLAGMALTLRSGFWLRYSLLDWVVGVFKLLWGALSGGFLLRPRKTDIENSAEDLIQEGVAANRTYRQVGKPVVFGLFLALPVVLLFGWLLGMADPVFARLMNEWIGIERWPEYIWRGFYIMIWAYLLAGIYLFMLFKSHDQKLVEIDGNQNMKKLGGIEAVTVLVSVNLLFVAFVAVQFHYFFGGQSNIHLEGFTYAEYARRGFFELLLVAVMSLMLFLGLGAFTHRNNTTLRWAFSGLGIVLVSLIGIMLYSAYLRLSMYELAYGFSRLRTYTHVFMVWLGILLLATVALEVVRKSRAFALALLLVSIGYGVSLGLLNVDAFIVRQNVMRANKGYALDIEYLTELSDDAVPAMAALYSTEQNPETRDALGAALACKIYQAKDQETVDWRSYHIGRSIAQSELEKVEPQLSSYSMNKVRGWVITLNGQEFQCYQSQSMW
jgi:hypothetical protein